MNDMCWQQGQESKTYYWDPGQICSAVMTDLKSSTQYFYRFGSPDNMSTEFSFLSPHFDGPIHAVVMGDMGTFDCQNFGGRPGEDTGWCSMCESFEILMRVHKLIIVFVFAAKLARK